MIDQIFALRELILFGCDKPGGRSLSPERLAALRKEGADICARKTKAGVTRYFRRPGKKEAARRSKAGELRKKATAKRRREKERERIKKIEQRKKEARASGEWIGRRAKPSKPKKKSVPIRKKIQKAVEKSKNEEEKKILRENKRAKAEGGAPLTERQEKYKIRMYAELEDARDFYGDFAEDAGPEEKKVLDEIFTHLDQIKKKKWNKDNFSELVGLRNVDFVSDDLEKKHSEIMKRERGIVDSRI